MATNPDDKPRDEMDKIQEEIDALLAEIRANGPLGIHTPPPMTDEELAEKDAEDERYIEELLREEAEWRAANPGVPRILGSDLIDEDRGPLGVLCGA